jgi:hypothetical protein
VARGAGALDQDLTTLHTMLTCWNVFDVESGNLGVIKNLINNFTIPFVAVFHGLAAYFAIDNTEQRTLNLLAPEF